MRLGSLHLKNIRSYTDETITFPAGTLLLAGDIGAGKTTILLAVEFALFGLLRGTTSGAGLLRNGAREGSVTLALTIQEKQITITRSLKQLKETIAQDAGKITIDGITDELTASELKARILDLLGYPKDLLTKNTSLLYRYTVYTAQEDMKTILHDTKEERLETLRCLFGIDKYKHITDNTKTFLSELRQRRAHLEGKIAELPHKQDALTACASQLSRLDPAPALTSLEKARAAVAEHKRALLALDTQLESTRASQHELVLTRERITAATTARTRLDLEIPRLASIIAQLTNTLSSAINRDDIRTALAQKNAEANTLQHTIRDLSSHIGGAKAQLQLTSSTLHKINGLDTCPLCLQHVTHEHKTTITNDQDKKKTGRPCSTKTI